MRILKSKKGVDQYISWVLLMAFMVVLGVMMHDFMTGYTKKTTERVKERVYNSQECDLVAVSIDSICQNTQNLYINVTNRRDISVDKLMFKLYDIYSNPENSDVNVTVNLGVDSSTQVIVLKQGEVKKVARIDAIPIVYREGYEIICTEKSGSVQIIPDCTEMVKRIV